MPGFQLWINLPAREKMSAPRYQEFDPAAVPWPVERTADRPPTVLFVGRQFARKGGDVLLSAFREARREVPEARLGVVGPDDIGAPEPGAQAARLGLCVATKLTIATTLGLLGVSAPERM